MSNLRLMPWKTHLALAIACPLAVVAPTYLSLGFGPADWPSSEIIMSFGILVVGWVVAAGLAVLEVIAVAGHLMSKARRLACLTHTWLAVVGTLPVWLAGAMATNDPVDLTWTRLAATSYALLLVGYLLCLHLAASRLDPETLRVDERAE